MAIKFFLALCLLVGATASQNDSDFLYGFFPPDFEWGLASASYQIEGGWNSDGKGESIWNEFSHRVPSPIKDNSTGDVACDSYNNYLEDVQLLKNIGANFYRFSLSWTRILPNGTGNVNQKGIDYYNNLIDALISNGIQPIVTLYHWDLPEVFQEEFGGWQNEIIVEHFENYARIAYSYFGDRVKQWITFNEPRVVSLLGYGAGLLAPGIVSVEAPYLVAHNILKSHAKAYRLYEREFKEAQQGQVGITINAFNYEPEDPDNPEHVDATERLQLFSQGWFGFPIFFGDYPGIMRELVDQKSREEGRRESRLPTFDSDYKRELNGSWDFLGLNHYTTQIVLPANLSGFGWFTDHNTQTYQLPEWPGSGSDWLKVVPLGFRKLLNWIKNTYGNPPVWITENGFSDHDEQGLNDTRRSDYYRDYCNEMLKAVVLDGCNVQKYAGWTIIDNFEWISGYTERFGVHHVDFNDPARTRTPKQSQQCLKKLFADNGFPEP